MWLSHTLLLESFDEGLSVGASPPALYYDFLNFLLEPVDSMKSVCAVPIFENAVRCGCTVFLHGFSLSFFIVMD